MRAALVVGDSLPFPRSSRGQGLADAWPQLLVASGAYEVLWMRARQGATCREVLAEATQAVTYAGAPGTFALGAVQVGIVDVTPRPLPRWVELLARRVHLDRRLKRLYPTLSRLRAVPWTSVETYERALADTFDVLAVACDRVVAVEVAPPGPELLSKVRAFDVAPYNAALRRAASGRGAVAVPFPGGDGLFLPDGHHLSAAGHRAVADAILAAVD